MKRATAKGYALGTVLVLGDNWERLAGIALQIGDADRIVVMARSHAAVRDALERNQVGLVVVDAPNDHAVKRLVLPLRGKRGVPVVVLAEKVSRCHRSGRWFPPQPAVGFTPLPILEDRIALLLGAYKNESPAVVVDSGSVRQRAD